MPTTSTVVRNNSRQSSSFVLLFLFDTKKNEPLKSGATFVFLAIYEKKKNLA